jgi:hypothetical protein
MLLAFHIMNPVFPGEKEMRLLHHSVCIKACSYKMPCKASIIICCPDIPFHCANKNISVDEPGK